MTDTTTTPDTAVIDAYVATWNEIDPAKRGELIAGSLAADLWYRDPFLEADGLPAFDAMIATVQAQFPRHRLSRTSGVDGHRDLVRFTWALTAPDGTPVLAGLDVAKFDGDGKLHRIIGFAGESVPAA